MTRLPFNSKLLVAAALACFAASAAAQGHPGGNQGGGNQGGGNQGGGMGGGFGGGINNFNHTTVTPTRNSASTEVASSRSGLQLGPPGRWWDNKAFARAVGINATQQQHMDDVFNANRDPLVKLYKGLQHEESQLEKLSRSRELDENQIFQQIDRVTQARGDLEKANAHYLLQIRKELTPDQTARLDDLRPALQQ